MLIGPVERARLFGEALGKWAIAGALN
jgi:hypothetical protein